MKNNFRISGTQVHFEKLKLTNNVYSSMDLFEDYKQNFFSYYAEMITIARECCFSPYFGKVISFKGHQIDPLIKRLIKLCEMTKIDDFDQVFHLF